ncbi:hypothetical protein B4Q13_16260, partial [Lacticaseibacillus rhamnosus]
MNGQVVLTSGEPGIGKSRLAVALIERLHAEPHIRLRYFCSPYHQDSALFPFIDQLGRASGFAYDDPPVAKLGKLEALLSGAAPADEFAARFRAGERLEAIVSVIAIAVLLLILNWFYHRVYWQENLQALHRKKKSILTGTGLSLAAAQVVGLVLLGFTSVYREGFE